MLKGDQPRGRHSVHTNLANRKVASNEICFQPGVYRLVCRKVRDVERAAAVSSYAFLGALSSCNRTGLGYHTTYGKQAKCEWLLFRVFFVKNERPRQAQGKAIDRETDRMRDQA